MKIIGITGGTGAGKTTALTALEELGAAVIDCDSVYHKLLADSVELIAAIGRRFPGTVEDGRLDRKKLGAIVFASPDELLALNAITDPFVTSRVSEILDEQERGGKKVAAIDAIGLFESGINAICNLTIAVTAPEEKRLSRIVAREGISREYARQRIGAQRPDEYYNEKCDYVLVNDFESEGEFRDYCKEFFRKLLGDDDLY